MLSDFAFSLADHLWQSTIFAIAAGLLTLALRKNHARVRFWIWWIASLKFLIPFSLLVSLGGEFTWLVDDVIQQGPPASLRVIEEFAQPFSDSSGPAAQLSPEASSSALPYVMLTIWLGGSSLLLLRWGMKWNYIRRLSGKASRTDFWTNDRELQTARRLEEIAGVRTPLVIVRSSAAIEPFVFGLFRPVLIWPAGLSEKLQTKELEAILLHELSHVRRRDNLTSAMHMVVEMLFCFHPLVWWLGARLVHEREQACDEDVLRWGGKPTFYAEGILKVCEYCLETPLVCGAGITGADLKRRIEAIMSHRAKRRLSSRTAILLGVAAIVSLTMPLVAGVVQTISRQSQAHAEVVARIESAVKTLATSIALPQKETSQVQLVAARAPAPLVATPAAVVQFDTFEIVSIRPTDPTAAAQGGRGGGPGQRGGGGAAPPGPCTGMIQLSPGRLVLRNVTLHRLVTAAYGKNCRLSTEQTLVSGIPEWANTAAYDIQATIPEGAPTYTPQQLANGEAPVLQAMLRNMLTDRFKLTLRRETKEIPIYNLVMVKPGRVKLSEDQTPPPPLVPPTGPPTPPDPKAPPPPLPRGTFNVGVNPPEGKVMIRANSVPIQTVINFIQGGVGRMVIDKIEPKGLYDIPEVELNVGPFEVAPGAVTVWPEIMSQLGLKMEPTRGPAELLVIERAEKPSEN